MVSTKSKKERIISVIIVLLLVVFCIPQNRKEQIVEDIAQELSNVDGTLEMHVIDVGQADCILIKQNDKIMLVDAGTMSSADKVVNYLKSLNITKIDVLVATHQHHDHIGGMSKILDNFEVGVIYMPDLGKEKIDTKSYKSFISSIEKWEQKEENEVLFAKDEEGNLRKFDLGQANVRFIAPTCNWYRTKNNYSIVMRITFGKTSILLTADAEKKSEMEMVNLGYNLKADVLKIGHHGCDSSTTEKFINEVDPDYAIISVGKNNDYGYPDKKVMDRLEKRKITVYRTDENGTIIMVTDGKQWKVNVDGDF